MTFTEMVDSFGHFGFFIGTSGGSRYEDAWTIEQVAVGKWYHVVVTYQNSDRSYRINVWSTEAEAVLAEKTGNMTNNISITDADVYIGARQSLADHRFFDGLLDEMVVFNDVLTPTDIAKIRAGTYGKP
jgi:hypothetical protein